MFGCTVQIKAGTEYYIFASLSDDNDSILYQMDFAVDPTSTSTPTNFVQQMNSIRTDPPQCGALPVF